LGEVSVEEVGTLADLGLLLRSLRRRQARRSGEPPLTYRELSARTGWSKAVIGDYFVGKSLPPADRFDELVRLLGASAGESRTLANARDRVEERRRVRPEPGVPGPLVPRQLPAAISHFTGRAPEVSALDGLLDGMDTIAGATTVCAIHGMPGIGKTTLAVYWAHRVAHRFPDGQIYLDLRGFGSSGAPVSPAEAIRAVLQALEVPADRIPAGLPAQVGLYRSLLAGRRMLVVLDNARDAEQVVALLPGTPGCLVLVTSRALLTYLVASRDAHRLALDLPSAAEARDLFVSRLGAAAAAADAAAVDEVVALCRHHPLALSIVAARAAGRPRVPLADLVEELTDADGGLDRLTGDDPTTSIAAVFSWSYELLTPAAAELFRLLGRHPGAEISTSAAASLAGVPVARARTALGELCRASLVAGTGAGRYRLHDLVREYAIERCQATDTDLRRDGALGRLLDHYLGCAHTAAQLLNPTREAPLLPDRRAGVSLAPLTTQRQAVAWLDAECAALLATIELAARLDAGTHAWQLAWAVADYLDKRGRWPEWVAAQHTAAQAATRAGDRRGAAVVHRSLGRGYTRLDRLDEADDHLRRATDLFEQVGDLAGQGFTRITASWLCVRQGRHPAALAHAEQALALFTAAGHEPGLAGAHNMVGWCHAQLGDHEQALSYCQAAVDLLEKQGDQAGLADSWDSLGYAHRRLEHHDLAVECYQRAVGLYRETHDLYNEADSLVSLGDTHAGAGHPVDAQDCWHAALVILDGLRHPRADDLRARLPAAGSTGTAGSPATADRSAWSG
jgi:tetratricopeptide (TPR) repeat protein